MKKIVFLLSLIFLTLTACDPSNEPTPLDITFTLLTGQDTVEIHASWEDAGAVFSVNGQESTITGNQIDTSQLGLHTVTYEATHDGETHRLTRYVMVADQTPPIITLLPGVDTVFVGEAWEDAGATVTDNSGETLSVQVSGEVNTDVVGTYIITYEATDSSGNTASVQRYVNVIE
jgi:hypothetical protein